MSLLLYFIWFDHSVNRVLRSLVGRAPTCLTDDQIGESLTQYQRARNNDTRELVEASNGPSVTMQLVLVLVFGGALLCANGSQGKLQAARRDTTLFPSGAQGNATQVLAMARALLNGTFNAGGSYADVWARDTATFIDIALDSNPSPVVSWPPLSCHWCLLVCRVFFPRYGCAHLGFRLPN